jgi:hypothetical protein
MVHVRLIGSAHPKRQMEKNASGTHGSLSQVLDGTFLDAPNADGFSLTSLTKGAD